MLIIGHRGAAGLVSENTISSFQKAEELGVGMIETDLRMSRKGEIVLQHNLVSAPGRNSKCTTLKELLDVTKIPVNLEIKEPGFEAELLEALKGFSSEVLISSKHPLILKKIRTLDEKVKIALVLGKTNFFLLPRLKKLDQKLHFYSIHPNSSMVNSMTLGYLKRLNKKIFVWTVNNSKKFEKLKALGIDGVFTDYPNKITN